MKNRSVPSRHGVSVLDFGASGDGVTDCFRAIQAALDSGAGHVLIPAGTYVIRSVLCPREGQCLEIHGTLKVADAVIRPLVKDLAAGDSTVEIDDVSGFFPGQWVTLHDDRLPIQGGGRKVRRQNAGNARITGISGNTIALDARSARSYLRSANAVLATQHSAILIRENNIRICGSGTIDGNKKKQLDAAPCRLEDEVGEDWRAASGIVTSGFPGRLENIVIEGLTVRDTVLHGIGMLDAVKSVIRNTCCLGAHDKNITLSRCRDCSIAGNIAAASEWEDGIIFHQRPDLEHASSRITIANNICVGNPRNGISIGANMHEIFLSGNLCAENGINLHISADNCVSNGDISIGCNGRLFPLELQRPAVHITGRTVMLNNLISLGSPSAAVGISGTDIYINGGLVGDMQPRGEHYDGIGLDICPGHRASRQPEMVPDRVAVIGLTIRNCRRALRVHPSTGRLTLRDNILDANESVGEIAPEVWGRVSLANNRGLVSHNRGVARIAPGETRVIVQHGLCRAPDMAAISVTPVGYPGDSSRFWVEKAGEESFEIAVDRAPGGAGATFAWQADAEESTG